MSYYMNDYQHKATSFALYQHDMYPVASLMVEAAELADLFIKPKLRGDIEEIDRSRVISEAGDVLWNLAAILKDNNITLDEVATYNLQKLGARAKRGTIMGSGEDR
jgi:NTP pyrophosphatase (non-canonical NTP hydrolase)